jgi:hypothetical protein
MRHRRRRGGDASDATPEIAAELARGEDAWPAAAVVDTSSGPAEALVAAVGVIAGDEAPPGGCERSELPM